MFYFNRRKTVLFYGICWYFVLWPNSRLKILFHVFCSRLHAIVFLLLEKSPFPKFWAKVTKLNVIKIQSALKKTKKPPGILRSMKNMYIAEGILIDLKSIICFYDKQKWGMVLFWSSLFWRWEDWFCWVGSFGNNDFLDFVEVQTSSWWNQYTCIWGCISGSDSSRYAFASLDFKGCEETWIALYVPLSFSRRILFRSVRSQLPSIFPCGKHKHFTFFFLLHLCKFQRYSFQTPGGIL